MQKENTHLDKVFSNAIAFAEDTTKEYDEAKNKPEFLREKSIFVSHILY